MARRAGWPRAGRGRLMSRAMRRAAAVSLLFATCLALAPPADAALRFKRCGPYAFTCARLSVPLDRSGAVPGRVSLLVKRVRARRRGGATARRCSYSREGPASPRRMRSGWTRSACCSALLEPRPGDLRPARHGPLRAAPLPPLERANLLRAGRGRGRCARGLGARGRSTRAATRTTTSTRSASSSAPSRSRCTGPRTARRSRSGTRCATRPRVERLVLDSTVEANGPDPFYLDTFDAVPRALGSLCRRRCPWTSDPVADLAALVERLGRGALRGRVVDRGGRSRVRASRGWTCSRSSSAGTSTRAAGRVPRRGERCPTATPRRCCAFAGGRSRWTRSRRRRGCSAPASTRRPPARRPRCPGSRHAAGP